MSLNASDWLELDPRFHLAFCKLCRPERSGYISRKDTDTLESYAAKIQSHPHAFRRFGEVSAVDKHKKAQATKAEVIQMLRESFPNASNGLLPLWEIKSANEVLPGVTQVVTRQRSTICEEHRCLFTTVPSYAGNTNILLHILSHGGVRTHRELKASLYQCVAQKLTDRIYLPLDVPYREAHFYGMNSSSVHLPVSSLVVEPSAPNKLILEMIKDNNDNDEHDLHPKGLREAGVALLDALFKGIENGPLYHILKFAMEEISPKVLRNLYLKNKGHAKLKQSCLALVDSIFAVMQRISPGNEPHYNLHPALRMFTVFSVNLATTLYFDEQRKHRRNGRQLVRDCFQGAGDEVLQFIRAPTMLSLKAYFLKLLAHSDTVAPTNLGSRVVPLCFILSVLLEGTEASKIRKRLQKALDRIQGLSTAIRMMSMMKALDGSAAQSSAASVDAAPLTSSESYMEGRVRQCTVVAQLRVLKEEFEKLSSRASSLGKRKLTDRGDEAVIEVSYSNVASIDFSNVTCVSI